MATVFTDRLGRPLAVGDKVHKIGALGAIEWSTSGTITALCRVNVKVHWARARGPVAIRPERLNLTTPGDQPR